MATRLQKSANIPTKNGAIRGAKPRRWNAPAAPRPVRWTSEQYHEMADKGWFQGRRVEFIGGEIVEMAPMLSPHWTGVILVQEQLRRVFSEGCLVTVQLPVRLTDDSEPEPDVAVIRGGLRDFSRNLPTTAVLIVEVSDSTLRFDRTAKASLYAAAGIEDYWVLNLNERQLEVHRTPVEQTRQRFGFGYQEKSILRKTDTISPLAAPEARIAVAGMLP